MTKINVYYLKTFRYGLLIVNNGRDMHVISRKPFKDACEKHPAHAVAIERTYAELKSGRYSCPEEMKRVFPSLDNFKYVPKWWVIDIAGNNLRLIAYINFDNKSVYIKHIVTHAEYDKITKARRVSK